VGSQAVLLSSIASSSSELSASAASAILSLGGSVMDSARSVDGIQYADVSVALGAVDAALTVAQADSRRRRLSSADLSANVDASQGSIWIQRDCCEYHRDGQDCGCRLDQLQV